ncbi:hypothetical protein EV421DRAFT_1738423 [Armillaria borealis]|uniref:Heterokaryon incompatibility domain-containing protein n=1 Tax=Armillaria borealis TaxID=47425 RepID=A0AA39MKY7_9AGAR|nr:hypothetical protein EV421DRAFT_1738423 [Armillaria borealis]
MNGGTISEAVPASLSNVGPEPPLISLTASSESGSVDEQWSSNSDDTSGDSDESDSPRWPPKDITFPEVIISAFTETGKAESSINVPLQRAYIDCVEKNYDFGTVYGCLRQIWYTGDWSNIGDELHRRDEKMRDEALACNRIVNPDLPPRRVWDLYSNRVVPWWTSCSRWQPISHAWVDEKDRMDVWTPINGKEWPVPIPKDASLDLIRIEMLNLGLEYAWLDVLCLRQKGGPKEDLCVEEWKLDMPTIGYVYKGVRAVIYLSGLGWPLSVTEGDLDSDRCWFRRAWTLQEVGDKRIIAGNTANGPMHAKPIDEDGNYETELLMRFHKQIQLEWHWWDIFGPLVDMQNDWRPILWTKLRVLHSLGAVLVNSMAPWMRVSFLLLYPGVGLGCKKWRPTWEQVMSNPLPVDLSCAGFVKYVDKIDEDWFRGPCIDKGLVRGLDVESAEGEDRCGELVVEGADGMAHTFTIRATHQFLIPEDMYMLLGSVSCFVYANPGHYLLGPFAGEIANMMRREYWAVGRRLPDRRFEKMSVVVMDDYEHYNKMKSLGIIR